MYSMVPFGQSSRQLNSLFDDFERSFFPAEWGRFPAFRTDIKDEGDHFLLEAELPGFKKEDINLQIQDGVLTISCQHDETVENKADEGKYVCRERRYGSVQRSFDVSGIKEDAISAAFEDGVLKLNLPKLGEEQPQSRKISIQ